MDPTGDIDDEEQQQPPSRQASVVDQDVLSNEALCQGTVPIQGLLIPALKGCPHCRTEHVIASPVLGTCTKCGGEMQLLLPLKE
jgi:hypothetical protein